MTDIVMTCDALARLATVVAPGGADLDPIFSTIRVDGGQAVATDRKFMAIENIGGNHPVFHLIPDPALVAQCRTEAAFNGCITITINEMLRYAVAKTTLGYVHPSNVGHWHNQETDFDRWRAVVMKAAEPAQSAFGGMFWDADGIAKLAASSPSGRVVFEETIDANRPTLIRDVTSHDWLGVFQPWSKDESYSAATLPSWMKGAAQ